MDPLFLEIMARFYKYFFKELITVLSVGVTLYLLFLFLS